LPLLLLKGVHLGCKPGDKTLYTQALHLYGLTTLDITDVIILAKLQHEDTAVVYSFDTDFDDFEGVTRKEPDAIEKEAA
jgi:predicted nucleic acid-binding protein